MFSKELEALINASLEDGVLEEYEKAAIVKRAKSEGVDITELEIYINSILQKRKRDHDLAEDAKQEKIDQRKREAFGRVCPNCGRQVPPMTLKCECGYEFTQQRTISSIQLLSEKLSNVTLTKAEEREIEEAASTDQIAKRETFIVNKKIDIISIFPVPNTKEDIIEFLSLAIAGANKKLGFMDIKTNCYKAVAIAGIIIPVVGWLIGAVFLMTKSFAEEKLKKAWREKFEQVLLKGRSLRGDAEFTQQLDYYESLLEE